MDINLPIWVEEALAECAACKDGSKFTFMREQEAQGKTAVGVEDKEEASTAAGSDWSGAGISDNENITSDIFGNHNSKTQTVTKIKKQRTRKTRKIHFTGLG
eukprot:8422915-Karenia_brevis.AAC.1